MIRNLFFVFLVFFTLNFSCSSIPKPSRQEISSGEARAFLQKHCSKLGGKDQLLVPVHGEILVRSSTKEFKGQYPASIRYSKEGNLILEVTHLLGGTVAKLQGNAEAIEIISPSKPQFNRKNVTQYMGLPVRLLLQLLHGDLPCPSIENLQTDGSIILLKDGKFSWTIERTDQQNGGVPYRAAISDGASIKIDLWIERWNQEGAYAEKVKVVTPEGELKWTWRTRTIQN